VRESDEHGNGEKFAAYLKAVSETGFWALFYRLMAGLVKPFLFYILLDGPSAVVSAPKS
jgi:hypothetical protein